MNNLEAVITEQNILFFTISLYFIRVVQQMSGLVLVEVDCDIVNQVISRRVHCNVDLSVGGPQLTVHPGHEAQHTQ